LKIFATVLEELMNGRARIGVGQEQEQMLGAVVLVVSARIQEATRVAGARNVQGSTMYGAGAYESDEVHAMPTCWRDSVAKQVFHLYIIFQINGNSQFYFLYFFFILSLFFLSFSLSLSLNLLQDANVTANSFPLIFFLPKKKRLKSRSCGQALMSKDERRATELRNGAATANSNEAATVTLVTRTTTVKCVLVVKRNQ